LLYYVSASSATLGDALKKVARYSRITNEGVQITCREGKNVSVRFEYVGVGRLGDRHQMEFFIVTLLRICRQLTGRYLLPIKVRFAHRRTDLPAVLKKLFGCEVSFGSNEDEVVYAGDVKGLPCLNGPLSELAFDSIL
jgi:hypothetical protein